MQNLPRIPSDQGSLPSLPFHVAIADGGLEIDARIKNEADVDKLIQILQNDKAAFAEHLRATAERPHRSA
jgi:hypothetical protein